MARELDHIALANRNHDAIETLLAAQSEHPEWVAGIAFYKALHIVEATFAHRGLGHSNGHLRRLEILQDARNGYQAIFRHYKRLLEASEIARYLSSRFDGDIPGGPFTSFTQYRSMENVREKLLKESLMNIEQHARQHLSANAKQLLKPAMSLFAPSSSE